MGDPETYAVGSGGVNGILILRASTACARPKNRLDWGTHSKNRNRRSRKEKGWDEWIKQGMWLIDRELD